MHSIRSVASLVVVACASCSSPSGSSGGDNEGGASPPETGSDDAGHTVLDTQGDGDVGRSDASVADAGAKTTGACDALPAVGTWEQITPPGVATSDGLALDPYVDGTLWLGGDPNGGGTPGLGGLFKSTDCGATWKHVNEGHNGDAIDQAHLWSLVIDPVERGVIYVVGAYGPGGLWKSINGGVDWEPLFPAASEFAKIVELDFVGNVSMDPHDHLHLVVGTHGACAPPYDPVCQAETVDGGKTWRLMRIPNPTGGWVERTGPYVVDATSWIHATPSNGIHLTIDHGATWKDVTPTGVSGAGNGEFTTKPLRKSPAGFYYLPATSPDSLMRSRDGHAWSIVEGSTFGGGLCVTIGGGDVFIADFDTGTYRTAPESDLSHWTTLPKPFTVGGGKQGAIYLEVDEVHHVLYSSNFTGGVWRYALPRVP